MKKKNSYMYFIFVFFICIGFSCNTFYESEDVVLPVEIRYTKQLTLHGQLSFNYSLTIKDGFISIKKEDKKYKLFLDKSEQITQEQLEPLVEKIKRSGFMDLERTEYGKVENTKNKMLSIHVTLNGQSKTIVVRNTIPPDGFIYVEEEVNFFANDFLNILYDSWLTAEEAKDKGLRAYQKAEKLFNNHKSKINNLQKAIIEYEKAISYLSRFEPPLPQYEKAIRRLAEAKVILEKKNP